MDSAKMVSSGITKDAIKRIAGFTRVGGYAFSILPNIEIAHILRDLADKVETQSIFVQAINFEEMTDVQDFVQFRWTIRFADRSEGSNQKPQCKNLSD